MAGSLSFEVPKQLRELAEKNLEQARAGYGQFIDAMTQAMSMWASAVPMSPMTEGFKVVQDRAIKFAKQNAEAYFSLASELASAQGPNGRNGYSSSPRADLDAHLCAASARAEPSRCRSFTEHWTEIATPLQASHASACGASLQRTPGRTHLKMKTPGIVGDTEMPGSFVPPA
jgi:hypothetical protein